MGDPTGGSVTATPRRESGLRTAGRWLREIVIVVVGALVASTLLRLFIVQLFVIPSESMENTLLVTDRIAVQKLAPFERGDVIVFRDTQGWLEPAKDDGPLDKALVFVGLAPDKSVNHLVKRVIGLAGDHVTCCDARGRLTVNGIALNEAAYLYTDPATGAQVDPSSMDFDVVVPAGTVFVMGDHRNDSRDSRCHLADQTPARPPGSNAFIPRANIVGTVVAVVYPFSRFQGIGRPATFENVPAGQPAPSAAVLEGPEPDC